MKLRRIGQFHLFNPPNSPDCVRSRFIFLLLQHEPQDTPEDAAALYDILRKISEEGCLERWGAESLSPVHIYGSSVGSRFPPQQISQEHHEEVNADDTSPNYKHSGPKGQFTPGVRPLPFL